MLFESGYPRKASERKIKAYQIVGFALLSIAFFIGFFHRFSPATFSSHISSSLGISATALGAIASMHFWVYTLMQVPAGAVVDKFGISRSVFAGTLLTAFGALILSQSTSFLMALIGPALVGLGVSTIFVGVMKFNIYWFSPQKYGLATGITMLIGTSGSVFAEGPSLFLLDFLTWREIFFLVAIATALISIMILLFVFDNPEKALLKGEGGVKEEKSIKVNDRAPFRSLRNKQIWLLLACTSGTNGTFYAFAGLWGVPLLVDSYNVSHSSAVMFITVSLCIYGVGSLALGYASDYIGRRKPFLLASTLLGFFSWGGLVVLNFSPTYIGWVLYPLLGLSASQVVVSFSSVKESVETHEAGISLAFVNMGVFLTSAIVQFMFGLVLDVSANGDFERDAYSIYDYKLSLIIPLVISACGFLAAIAIKETYPRNKLA